MEQQPLQTPGMEKPSTPATPPPAPKLPAGNPKAKNHRVTITIIGILVVIGIIWLLQSPSDTSVTENTEHNEMTESSFENRTAMKEASLLANFQNSVMNSKPTNTFDKKLAVTGKFKKAYLYVKASVNGKPIENPDDVYVNFTAAIAPGHYEAFGGHLLADGNLAPENTESTELYTDATSVTYKERYYQDDTAKKTSDWVEVLNNYQDQRVVAFISTLGQGTIENLSFYYECAEGENCSITLK